MRDDEALADLQGQREIQINLLRNLEITRSLVTSQARRFALDDRIRAAERHLRDIDVVIAARICLAVKP
jgi:hypothetical protein